VVTIARAVDVERRLPGFDDTAHPAGMFEMHAIGPGLGFMHVEDRFDGVEEQIIRHLLTGLIANGALVQIRGFDALRHSVESEAPEFSWDERLVVIRAVARFAQADTDRPVRVRRSVRQIEQGQAFPDAPIRLQPPQMAEDADAAFRIMHGPGDVLRPVRFSLRDAGADEV
jgi:hypothetical protein